MNSKKRFLLALLLGVALFAGGPTQARADIITTVVGVPGTPVAGGLFSYTYALSLAPDSALLPPGAISPLSDNFLTGDLYTYYDAFGLVPGSVVVTGALAANTTISFPLLGVTPIGTFPVPPDDPTAT